MAELPGFTIRERVKLDFNFEAFDVFNRVTNTSVLNQAYRADVGVLTPIAGVGTGTSARQRAVLHAC